MAAHLHAGSPAAAHCAPPRFADCKACGKLTLQTGAAPCQDRQACHGVVIEIRAIAPTERGAFAGKPGQ
jgi:hypothetical protein